MATSALARASILCVRGPYYEYNGRGYAVLPGVDIRYTPALHWPGDATGCVRAEHIV